MKKNRLFIENNFPVIFTGFVLGLLFIPPILEFQSLYWGTPALQFIPWRIFAFEELSKGIIPFFNPYNGLNAPFLANYQSALFYPPSWLLYILGIVGGNSFIAWGFGLLNYFHLIWAALGMMCLTRKMGIKTFGQTISCISFACSQCLIARQGFISMIWTAAWLPWLFYLIERRLHSDSKRDSWVWGICVGFMLLAGHAQWSFYQLIFCAIWWIYRCDFKKSNLSFILRNSIFLFRDSLLGIGLACVQLLPTAELLLNSQRASSVDYELAMTYSFWQWRLLTLFLPNIFGNPGNGDYWGYGAFWEDAFYFGVIPAIMLFLSLRNLFHRTGEEKENINRHISVFFWVSAMIAIILAMGKNTPIFPFLYRYIPGFDMFQAPARFMLIAVFSFSLLAGLGSQNWRQPEGKSLYWTRLGTAGSAAIVVTSFVIHKMGIIEKESIPIAFFVTGLCLFLFGVLSLTFGLEGNKKKIWRIVLFSVLTIDIVYANYQIIPWIDSTLYQSKQASQDDLPANTGSPSLVFFDEDGLYDLKFNKFLKFGNFNNKTVQFELRENYIPDINMIDHVSVMNNFDPLLTAQYAAFMDYQNELSEQAQIEWLYDMGVTIRGNSDETAEAYLETIPSEWKPVVWTNCAIHSNGIPESLDLLNDQILKNSPERRHQNRCAIVGQESELGDMVDLNAKGSVKVVETTPQRMIVKVDSNSPGWLSFRRSWYPGWKIKIDKEAAQEVVLTDVNFMGISVAQGSHRVELYYQATVFYVGLAISLLSLVFLAGLKYPVNQ